MPWWMGLLPRAAGRSAASGRWRRGHAPPRSYRLAHAPAAEPIAPAVAGGHRRPVRGAQHERRVRQRRTITTCRSGARLPPLALAVSMAILGTVAAAALP